MVPVESPSAHFIVINTPGGFEQMFKLGPKTPEESHPGNDRVRHGIIGPHPREAASA